MKIRFFFLCIPSISQINILEGHSLLFFDGLKRRAYPLYSIIPKIRTSGIILAIFLIRNYKLRKFAYQTDFHYYNNQ